MSLGFKLQNIAFPIPTLPFFLFTFPKHKPATAGPGGQPALSRLSDVYVFSCYIMWSPFPSPPAFALWSWWESPPGAKPRKGAAHRAGCVFPKLLYCSLGGGNYHVLLTVLSSCSQLSTSLSRLPALGLLLVLLWQRLLDHGGRP